MAERKPLSKKLRFAILNRDNFTCQYCGRKAPDVKLEIDHIVPVAKGGKTEFENLITACHDCNSGKKAESLIRPTTIESADLLIEEYQKAETALRKFNIAKRLLSLYSDKQILAMVIMWESCIGWDGEGPEEKMLMAEYIKNEARTYVSRYGRIKALSKWIDMVQDNMKLDDDWNEFLKENESIWED